MHSSEITLSDLNESQLDGALVLSREAGWPHRREDWELMLQLSDGVVALAENRVLGTALMTPFGTDAATINMVIVAEAARGRGLGRRLMQAALSRCGDRECRLTATQAGLPLYESLGFVAQGSIVQHQGNVAGGMAPTTVRWAEPHHVSQCIALDTAACGMDRQRLITHLTAVGQLAILEQDDGVTGFAALRAFGRGEVVGPVVAASADAAQALVNFMFAARPGAFLRVDTAEPKFGLWLEGQGLAVAGGGIVMWRNPRDRASSIPSVRTYALASQALG